MKTCTECRLEKPLTEFHLDRQRGQRKSKCRDCKSKRSKQWRSDNLVQVKTREKSYDDQNKLKRRNAYLLRKYGICLEEYNQLKQLQNDCCKACGKPPSLTDPYHPDLVVDHDHSTGKVRGLLCDRCNKVLGLIGEDLVLLEGLGRYMECYLAIEKA